MKTFIREKLFVCIELIALNLASLESLLISLPNDLQGSCICGMSSISEKWVGSPGTCAKIVNSSAGIDSILFSCWVSAENTMLIVALIQ